MEFQGDGNWNVLKTEEQCQSGTLAAQFCNIPMTPILHFSHPISLIYCEKKTLYHS
jgi:hypothetical protein